MNANLKIALKRQKKLILLFLITIFLPSVLLSIFGIQAIRNERFRITKQIETEHGRIAELVKTKIRSHVQDLDARLQNIVQHAAFTERDIATITELLRQRLLGNPFMEQLLVFYGNEDAVFPFMQPLPKRTHTPMQLRNAQLAILKQAEEAEFIQQDHQRAISLYRESLLRVKEGNHRAEILHNIARNYIKLRWYREASKQYLRILAEFPESVSSSGLPFALIAGLQLIDCHLQVGDIDSGLKSALQVYDKIISNALNLTEDQFNTFAAMIAERISELLSGTQLPASVREHGESRLQELKNVHMDKIKQWQVVHNLKRDCIPELRRLMQSKPYMPEPLHHAKTIENKDYLLSVVLLPDTDRAVSTGVVAVKLNDTYLQEVFLNDILGDIALHDDTNLLITDLSGDILYGNSNAEIGSAKVTAFFSDNFPPWHIELSHKQPEGLGIFGLFKNFYFWTIATLIVILIFGTGLIVRTVAHELEVLKIKSDFVSSVSHELKTPLTSIKALTERLLAGKVRSTTKKQQYYALIAQDTERLTRLVGNILNFSKIEEGKKEYELEETDVGQWLDQTIEYFRQETMQSGVCIHTHIPEHLPYLMMDKDAMAQAVYNLFDNAIKFSREKKEIEFIVTADEHHISIKIRDFGIGIPEDEVMKIFEKFYQGSNASNYSVKGTGLGLALVKHTVAAHGGTISVERNVGQGSTFSIWLPVKI